MKKLAVNIITTHNEPYLKNALESVKKLDPEMFKARINLDLGEDEKPEPDENDIIFCTGKKLYSGKQREYKRANKKTEKEVVSYVKTFDLNPGRVLHFSKAECCEEECASYISEKDLSFETKERFERYEALLLGR